MYKWVSWYKPLIITESDTDDFMKDCNRCFDKTINKTGAKMQMFGRVLEARSDENFKCHGKAFKCSRFEMKYKSFA